MNALKTLLAGVVLAGFCTVCNAQIPKLNKSGYNQLLGKDFKTVLKTLNIKDTTGLTHQVLAPQIEKGTKFLALKVPNAQELLFKDNIAKAVVNTQGRK